MNEATEKVLQVLRRPKAELSPKEMAKDLATEGWQRKHTDAKRQYATRGDDGKKIKDSPKDKKRSNIGEGVQRRTSQALYDRLGLKSKNIDFELFHRGVNIEKKDKLKTKGDLSKAAHEAQKNLSEKPDKYKEDVEESVQVDERKQGIMDKIRNALGTSQEDFLRRYHESPEYKKTKMEKAKQHGKKKVTEEVEILQLDEKIHPGADWHKNDPDELMDHIYWLHGKKSPKDLAIRSKAYQGLVRQLHSVNPAPHKKALDRHMNHHINQAKKKLLGKLKEEFDLLDEGNQENKAKKNAAVRQVGKKVMIGVAQSYRKQGEKYGAKRAMKTHDTGLLRVGRHKLREAFDLLDESVVSAAHAHREPVSQSLKWEMQKRKDKRKEQMSSVMADAKKEYQAAIAPKPKSDEKLKAKRLAVSDMKKKPVTEARDADERAGDKEDRQFKRKYGDNNAQNRADQAADKKFAKDNKGKNGTGKVKWQGVMPEIKKKD